MRKNEIKIFTEIFFYAILCLSTFLAWSRYMEGEKEYQWMKGR